MSGVGGEDATQKTDGELETGGMSADICDWFPYDSHTTKMYFHTPNRVYRT